MLFTVNVESQDPPAEFLISDLGPGSGAESTLFDPSLAELNWPNDLPLDSQTGAQVVPGKAEMDLLIRYFARLIKVNSGRVVTLGYRNWAWPGHTEISKGMRVRYTVNRVKPRLECTDVTWDFVLLDHNNKPAVTMNLQQRIYL